MKRHLTLLFAALAAATGLHAQTEPVKFAFLADVHLCADSPRIGNLERCIEDINSQDDIQFVLFGGDITEFGADHEIALAKEVIGKLEKPCYVLAGNHDAKWSESGCNTFAKVFGYEQFEFEKGGIKFIGCNSGPNMRMAPALLPHESLVWLDSIVTATPPEQPLVFVNHFPQDTSMLNYFQVINTLKKGNIQMLIGGHWHSNVILNYQGVPGILGRSPDHGSNIGYNIMTIKDNKFETRERIVADKQGNPLDETRDPWFSLDFHDKPLYTPETAGKANDPYGLPADFPWMDFDINGQYPEVSGIWRVQDEGDVGDAVARAGKYVVYANTSGVVKALDFSTGKEIWRYATEGKVFSSPAIKGRRVVIGSTDGSIYCLSLRKGRLLWKHQCEKSVLATPVIQGRKVYCGSSDNAFRALKLRNGKLVWKFDGVKGFVESRPYIDKEQVVFGDWANTLYSLDPETGALQWSWETHGSRMLSPAAVWPVKANGRIFIATPERKTYAIDAATGEQIWVDKGGRESVALSPDGKRLYVKTMSGTMEAFSTDAEDSGKLWETVIPMMGYEISPTPCATTITDGKELLFMPTDKGNIYCLSPEDGSVIWAHKVSVAMINNIVPLPDRQLLISTMDGIITRLQY